MKVLTRLWEKRVAVGTFLFISNIKFKTIPLVVEKVVIVVCWLVKTWMGHTIISHNGMLSLERPSLLFWWKSMVLSRTYLWRLRFLKKYVARPNAAVHLLVENTICQIHNGGIKISSLSITISLKHQLCMISWRKWKVILLESYMI